MKSFVKSLAQCRTSLILVIAGMLSLSAFAVDVAKVNGRVITDADVKAALASFNEGQRRQILNDANTKQEIVGNLVDQELLVQEAEKQKLDKTREYSTAYKLFRRQYLADRVLAKNVRPKLTESAAKKYYENYRKNYSQDKVAVQHILVSDEKTAMELLKQARASGADFQALAEKNSKDPSAKNNRGDLGIITRDAPFVDAFKEAAFNAKEGEIVGPVKTNFGYHLIKVTDKKPGKVMGYDEVEMRVKSDLQRDMTENYVLQLKKASSVTLNEKEIRSLQ